MLLRRILLRLFALLLGLGAVGLVAAWAPRGVGAARDLEVFRVAALELEGGRWLSLEEAVAAAAVPQGATVWDDPAPWIEGLSAHPLVRVAGVKRRLPHTLVLVVEEREPVALVPTPVLRPVDGEGHLLPIDLLTQGMDLPLLAVSPAAGDAEARIAKLAAEAARLARIDPGFLGRVSELDVDERGDLLARWDEPRVTFRFRPSVPASRLHEGVLVLADATERAGGRAPAAVDLRFADQVVVSVR